MQIRVLALVLLAAVVVASADNQGTQLRSLLTKRTTADDHDSPKIHPPLDPQSHRVFYKYDYPDNEQPPVTKDYAFHHPYPIVQEDKVYDVDYVKDENADNGEWQAQMDYDNLRHKIRKIREGVDEHKKWADQAKKDMDKAEEDWKKAQDAVDDAKTAAKKGDKESKDANDKVTDLTGEVGKAVEKVKKEMKDFEKCKEDLEKAQAKLQNILEEHEEHLQEKASAEADKAQAQRLENSVKFYHEQMKKTFDHEVHEAQEAEKIRDELARGVNATMAELDKAAAKLRKIRGEDSDGNRITKAKKEKSAATFSLPSATVLLSVLAIALASGNYAL